MKKSAFSLMLTIVLSSTLFAKKNINTFAQSHSTTGYINQFNPSELKKCPNYKVIVGNNNIKKRDGLTIFKDTTKNATKGTIVKKSTLKNGTESIIKGCLTENGEIKLYVVYEHYKIEKQH